MKHCTHYFRETEEQNENNYGRITFLIKDISFFGSCYITPTVELEANEQSTVKLRDFNYLVMPYNLNARHRSSYYPRPSTFSFF